MVSSLRTQKRKELWRYRDEFRRRRRRRRRRHPYGCEPEVGYGGHVFV